MRTTFRRVAAPSPAPRSALSRAESSSPAARRPAAPCDPAPSRPPPRGSAGELTNGRQACYETRSGGFESTTTASPSTPGFARRCRRATRAVAAQVRDAVAAHINDYITGEALRRPGQHVRRPDREGPGLRPGRGGDADLVRRRQPGHPARVALVGTEWPDRRRQHVRRQRQHHRPVLRGPRARPPPAAPLADDATGVPAQAAVPGRLLPARPRRRRDQLRRRARDPDTDVTAFAVLNLQNQRPEARRSARRSTKAVDWLGRPRQADGSFGGGGVTAAPNTNSTGLAGWAFGESCRVAAAAARRRAACAASRLATPGSCRSPPAPTSARSPYDAARAAPRGQVGGITDSDQRPVAPGHRAGRARPGWAPGGAARTVTRSDRRRASSSRAGHGRRSRSPGGSGRRASASPTRSGRPGGARPAPAAADLRP